MAVQLIFYFFYVILDNFKLKKQYVKLKLVLTVLINLTQLIKTMHDIYKIWGSNSESKKKKLVLTNGWMESNEPEQSASQCPSWAWIEEKKLIDLLIVVIDASSVMLSTSLNFTAGGMGPHLFSFVSCMLFNIQQPHL